MWFQFALLFPEEGLVYNYRLDDAGISSSDSDDAIDDDEGKEKKVKHPMAMLMKLKSIKAPI